MSKLAVYLGRFSPMHLGHQKVIDTMISDYGVENSLLIIGSANTPQSLRHFFTYAERRLLIKLIYEDLPIVGLPDFPGDNDGWFQCIGDIINLKGTGINKVTFYTGCHEDVEILSRYTKNFKYCNRFDGTTPTISATQVRDALIHQRTLDGLVYEGLQPRVISIFNKRWNEFQNK